MTRTLERGFIKPFINNFLGLLDRKVKRNVPLSPVSKRVKLWEKKTELGNYSVILQVCMPFDHLLISWMAN